MNLFETIKKNLAMCLYHPNQTRLNDIKRLLAAFMLFLAIVSFLAFLVYEAENMEEYVFSAYFMNVVMTIFCSFIHTSTETATMFVLIDRDIIEVIKKSKFELKSILFFGAY